MKLGIIGGTGLYDFAALEPGGVVSGHGPFGKGSGKLTLGRRGNIQVFFLARHGNNHSIPPHKVNYRANIWAFKQAGVDKLIAVNAVGGIGSEMGPGTIIIPDQVIDYTHGREMTFFDSQFSHDCHVDFTHPYDNLLRDDLMVAAKMARINVIDEGTLAVMQGPRLETAAEVLKLERDGCDLVGMTTMPEAVLAREQGLAYASINLVANWAAGKSSKVITTEEIEAELARGMVHVKDILRAYLEVMEQG